MSTKNKRFPKELVVARRVDDKVVWWDAQEAIADFDGESLASEPIAVYRLVRQGRLKVSKTME